MVYEFSGPIIEGQMQFLLSDFLTSIALLVVGFQAISDRAASLQSYVHDIVDRCGAAAFERSPEFARLTHDIQFERMTAIVEKSQAHALAAVQFHEAATEKLNAADYAMHRLYADLGAVMPQFAKSETATQTPQCTSVSLTRMAIVKETAQAA